ncbi:MAG: AmmeMemoRadiSam system protein B [Pseudomonadota bacterium]
MTTRLPELAGAWYPNQEKECLAEFDSFEQTSVPWQGEHTLRGGILPHAGWSFSGRLAYNVVREIASRNPNMDTVILYAGHLSPNAPISIMTTGDYWTPLGPIPTDEELATQVAQQRGVHQETPENHSQDNSAEVQFPLIKRFFKNARLVVVNAPPRPEILTFADALAKTATQLNRKIAILGSTDLTHYGPNYAWTPRGTGHDAIEWVSQENDPPFIEAVRNMDPHAILQIAREHKNACCAGAAAAAVQTASRLGSKTGELLGYATSAEIHPSSSFVGYAAMVF